MISVILTSELDFHRISWYAEKFQTNDIWCDFHQTHFWNHNFLQYKKKYTLAIWKWSRSVCRINHIRHLPDHHWVMKEFRDTGHNKWQVMQFLYIGLPSLDSRWHITNMSLLQRRHYCWWWTANVVLHSELKVFEQGGCFILPQLLWQVALISAVSSQGTNQFSRFIR